jgi:hypothetical protein
MRFGLRSFYENILKQVPESADCRFCCQVLKHMLHVYEYLTPAEIVSLTTEPNGVNEEDVKRVIQHYGLSLDIMSNKLRFVH